MSPAGFDATVARVPMPRSRLPAAVAVAVVAVALLAAYGVLWATVTRAEVGRADFTATYVGATLLRDGHGASIYDQSLQAPLHAALVAPQHQGNLPYVNPPLAAALVAPLTLLPLVAAYRLWQAAQLLMLLAAVLVAVRAAPWPAAMRRGPVRAAIALAALAGTGTVSLGLLAQWDGLSALGLAGAYALWRRDRRAAGGALLACTALVAKPHLALGLAALLAGWRDRRVLAGAAIGLVATGLASLAVVGPGGLAGFAGALQADAGRWPLASLLGFTGLTGSWLGNGATAQLVAALGSAAAVGACVALGHLLRRGRVALEPALAAATLLSLVASPHLLSHDLVLLAPAFAWLAAWAAGRDAPVPWPGAWSRAVLAGWTVIALATAIDLGAQSPAPPGRLVPWALAGLAAILVWRVVPRPRQLRTAPT